MGVKGKNEVIMQFFAIRPIEWCSCLFYIREYNVPVAAYSII